MAKADDKKKQIPLRISDRLYQDLSAWAQDDFRSINGQIEFLLTECVKWRKGGKGKKPTPSEGTTNQEEHLP